MGGRQGKPSAHTFTSLVLSPMFIDSQDDKVSQYMTKFKRSSTEPYTMITPLSPLSDLEGFLKTNIFALGTSTPLQYSRLTI